MVIVFLKTEMVQLDAIVEIITLELLATNQDVVMA